MTDYRGNQTGFTLLELMLALSIAAIIVTIGVPQLSDSVRNNRRTSTVNNYLTGLQIARSEAIARNRRIGVCPTDDGALCSMYWNDGILVFDDVDNDAALDTGEDILFASAAQGALTIVSPDFAGFLLYRPNGRVMVADPRDSGGEILFCDPRGPAFSRAIIIEASGRPGVSHHDSAGTEPAC